jgi:hypothetical protein
VNKYFRRPRIYINTWIKCSSGNDGAFLEGRVDACRRSSVYIDGIETVDLVLVVVKWVLMYLKVSFNTECFETGRTGSVYNLPLTNAFTIPQLMTRVQDIYERQQYAFRLNLEFGLILFHVPSHLKKLKISLF